MQIHLSPRHLRLTAAIHQAVAGQIGQLEELGTEIVAAHVVLIHSDAKKPGERYSVKVHLAISGPDIHAEDSEDDLYIALERVTTKLTRLLQKRKATANNKHRKTSQRVAETSRVAGVLPRSVKKELQSVRKVAKI